MTSIKTTRKIIAAMAAAGLALTLSSCSFASDKIGELAGEKIGKKVLEEAVGGEIDLDVDGDSGSMTIKGDDGTQMEIGTAKFPDGWPSDLYYPGNYEIIQSVVHTHDDDDGLDMIVALATEESLDDLKNTMIAQFEGSSFTREDDPIEQSLGELNSYIASYANNEYSVFLSVSEIGSDEGTMISYGLTFLD